MERCAIPAPRGQNGSLAPPGYHGPEGEAAGQDKANCGRWVGGFNGGGRMVDARQAGGGGAETLGDLCSVRQSSRNTVAQAGGVWGLGGGERRERRVPAVAAAQGAGLRVGPAL